MIIHNKKRTDEEVVKFVKDYVDNVENKPWSRYNDCKKVIPEVKAEDKKRALDYGCGWGHLSVLMQNKGYWVDSIDLMQNEIDICNHVWGENERINFSKEVISSFDEGCFDLVLSTQVIEHVHNVGNYLSEINRVLKPNGKIIITLPNVITPRFIIPMMSPFYSNILHDVNDKILDTYVKGTDHVNAWDPYHFVILMSTLGFKLDNYKPSERVAFPKSKKYEKLFGHYWGTKRKRLKQLSYTMVFEFTKVKEVRIEPND